jgi:pyrimidine-specific ribonucleoside hydrolase
VKIPVVLDVDTGVDDACALLLAARHPDVDLRAVTCVAGNAPVDDVVRNTRIALDAAGRLDVPVGRGARRPLLEAPRPARHVHGEDGMGDLGLPEPAGVPDPLDAVDLLRDMLVAAADAGERVTLVPLAPMTNVALLLRTYPDAARGIARIVFMGGAALVGNATAAAEFNVFHDPEAAAIVLDAAAELGVPVTMYGLDVFYDVRVPRTDAERLAASGDPGARLGGRLVLFQCDRFGGDDATIGDAGALCAVLDPAGLVTHRWPVRVELTGSWTRGQTVVDRRPATGGHDHDPHGIAPTVVDVALGVEGPRYARLWISVLGGISGPASPRRPTAGRRSG